MIKHDLSRLSTVMFRGTPCIIWESRGFLGDSDEKLLRLALLPKLNLTKQSCRLQIYNQVRKFAGFIVYLNEKHISIAKDYILRHKKNLKRPSHIWPSPLPAFLYYIIRLPLSAYSSYSIPSSELSSSSSLSPKTWMSCLKNVCLLVF